jgi:superfamily II DNA or RNA helicase
MDTVFEFSDAQKKIKKHDSDDRTKASIDNQGFYLSRALGVDVRAMMRLYVTGGSGPTGPSEGRYYSGVDVMHFFKNVCLPEQRDKGEVPNAMVVWKAPQEQMGRYSHISPHNLYDFQREAVNSCLEDGGNVFKSGVLNMECGTGKTVCALELIRLCNGCALIGTCKETSVVQWQKEAQRMGFKRIVTLRDRHRKTSFGWKIGEPLPDLIICTYSMMTLKFNAISRNDFTRSYSGRIELIDQLFIILKYSNQLQVQIFDECHQLPAKQWKCVASTCAKLRIGLSGSLTREDGRIDDLEQLIGPTRFQYQRPDHEGCAVEYTEIRVANFPAPPSFTQQKKLESDSKLCTDHLNRSSLLVNPYKMIYLIDNVRSSPSGSKVLVYCDYIAAIFAVVNCLKHALENEPIEVLGPITGTNTLNEREDALESLRQSSKTCVIVTTKIFDQSIDFPPLTSIHQLGHIDHSRTQEVQRLGRGRRNQSIDVSMFVYSTVNTSELENTRVRIDHIKSLHAVQHITIDDFDDIDTEDSTVPDQTNQEERESNLYEVHEGAAYMRAITDFYNSLDKQGNQLFAQDEATATTTKKTLPSKSTTTSTTSATSATSTTSVTSVTSATSATSATNKTPVFSQEGEGVDDDECIGSSSGAIGVCSTTNTAEHSDEDECIIPSYEDKRNGKKRKQRTITDQSHGKQQTLRQNQPRSSRARSMQ